MNPRRFVTQAVSWTMLGSVVVAALALIVVPKVNGAKPLTVLSGSMSGTYEIGDVVVVRPVDTDRLGNGDVITFQPVSDDPTLTTHRIIGETFGNEGRMFVTQGDANPAPDPNPVKPEQVMGQVWYSVPVVGHASVWMAGDWAQTAIHVLAGLLLLYGGHHILTGLFERRRGDGVAASPGTSPVTTPVPAPHLRARGGMILSFHLAFASAGVLALAAVVILLVGPPARAEGSRLLVGSSAGGPFLDQLPTTLFDDAGLIAPGDKVGDTFWIKNASVSPAHVNVTVVDAEPDNELEAVVTYKLAIGGVRTPDGPAGRDTTSCDTVGTGPVLAPGEVQPVDVTAHVGDLDGQRGMGQVASVDLVVTLTQTVAAGDLEVCGDEATGDPDPSGDPTGGGHDADGVDCSRDVVVTTAGTPTCVPTVVDAGVDSGFGGGAALDTRPAAIALGVLGGMLLIWAQRRRREHEYTPRHRA